MPPQYCEICNKKNDVCVNKQKLESSPLQTLLDYKVKNVATNGGLEQDYSVLNDEIF